MSYKQHVSLWYRISARASHIAFRISPAQRGRRRRQPPAWRPRPRGRARTQAQSCAESLPGSAPGHRLGTPISAAPAPPVGGRRRRRRTAPPSTPSCRRPWRWGGARGAWHAASYRRHRCRARCGRRDARSWGCRRRWTPAPPSCLPACAACGCWRDRFSMRWETSMRHVGRRAIPGRVTQVHDCRSMQAGGQWQ